MTSAATAAGVKVVFAEKLRAHSPFANSERVWMYKDSSHPDREMGYGVWMYKDWGMGSGAWYKGR
jgi:hypothetical protein